MRIDSPTFAMYNEARVKSPRFVVRIAFDVDSLAITSHAGIVGVTAGTVLEGMLAEPTVTSQRLKPDDAVAEIGSASFALIDVGIRFTDEVRERLLDGASLRNKLAQFYVGYDGLNFSDFRLVATQTISSVNYSEGRYEISCLDIQRTLRANIFEPVQTTLASTVEETDVVINVASIAGLTRVLHGAAWSDAPSATVGYIKIKTEVIRYTGIVGTQLQGCTRGVFNTIAARYVVDAATPSDRREKVTEYIYLELPSVKLAYAVLTGIIAGTTPGSSLGTLPANWHLGIAAANVREADFRGIGTDLWDPASDSVGFPLRFEGLAKTDGKRFLEKEIYLATALFSPVYSDGVLGLRRMTRLSADAAIGLTLDESNVVSCGGLQHDMRALHNAFIVEWSWNGTEFRRATSYLDAASAAKHGEAETLSLSFKGLHGAKHTDGVILSMLAMLRDRYAGPPLRMDLQVLPSLNRIEVGDVVKVRLHHVRDYSAGAGAPTVSIDRAFEIQNVSTDYRGAVSLDLFASTADPAISPPTVAASAALPDAYYTAAGTLLSSVPGVVIAANVMTAAPVTPLAGNVLLASAVYYHNADLTIGPGVNLLIAANVQLRVRGFLTINGTINGAARGLAGVADDGRVLVSFPARYGIFQNSYYEAILGNPGYVGTTRGHDGVVGVRPFTPAAITGYYETRPAALAVSKYAVAPRLMLSVSGNALLGLPADLRGGGGPPGGRTQIYSSTTNTLNAPIGLGGTGGNGGAGLAIICRGMGFGVNGYIDLSGANTASPAGATDASTGMVYHPGAGGPGGPGTLLVLLDGSALSVPDLAAGKYRGKMGTATITGTPLPRQYENYYNHVLNGTTEGVASPSTGMQAADFKSINGLDMSGATLLVQYVPGVELATADQDSPVLPVTALATESAEQAINVTMTVPVDVQAVELYMSSTNDRANATKVFDGYASVVRVRVPDGATRYFWARTRTLGLRSTFFPVSAVAGVAGTSVGGLICRGNCEAFNDGVRKNVASAAGWDSDAYTRESYANGVYVSFLPMQTTAALMVGLNADPALDSSYTSLDYAWYCRADGTLMIAESGAFPVTLGAYTAATVLGLSYDGQVVRYLQDGVVIRAVNAAGLTLFVDSSFSTPGGAIRNLKYGPVATAPTPPWIARGNCVCTVNSISKVGGAAAWDSDCYSQKMYEGGCVLTCVPYQTTAQYMIGLNTDPTTDQNYTSIDFAFLVQATGDLAIWESGVSVLNVGTYTNATVLTIKYDGQQVQYFVNGLLKRTVPLLGAVLFMDCSFLTPGGIVRNVEFSPLTTAPSIPWIARNGCVATATTIKKVGGVTGVWDSDCYSAAAYREGCALSFQVDTAVVAGPLMIGLNTDPTLNQSYTSLDFAFHLDALGGLEIYESNVVKLALGTGQWDANTTFAIVYDGLVVRYFKNGGLLRDIYAPSKAFYMDSSFREIGSAVRALSFVPTPRSLPVQFLARTDQCMVGDTTATKIAGALDSWDNADVISIVGYPRCFMQFKFSQTNCDVMAGLNSDPYTDSSYTSLDAAWYGNGSGGLSIRESGVAAQLVGIYTTATVLGITFDGIYIRYYKDGFLVRATAAAYTMMFFDSSFYHAGASINSMKYGPVTVFPLVDTAEIGDNAVAEIISATSLSESQPSAAPYYHPKVIITPSVRPYPYTAILVAIFDGWASGSSNAQVVAQDGVTFATLTNAPTAAFIATASPGTRMSVMAQIAVPAGANWRFVIQIAGAVGVSMEMRNVNHRLEMIKK